MKGVEKRNISKNNCNGYNNNENNTQHKYRDKSTNGLSSIGAALMMGRW